MCNIAFNRDMRVLKAISTFPNVESARKVIRELVSQKLIACGNIIPHVESIYMWEGELCEETEVLAIMKTHEEKISSLKQVLSELHPYEVPELIITEIVDGSDDYLNWVREI